MRIRSRTPKGDAVWKAWLDERPPVVRVLAERFPPTHLFRIKTTDQRVVVVSYSENGTMRIQVLAEYNPKHFRVGIQVFGIAPDDLEDLPEDEMDTIEQEEVNFGEFQRELRDRMRITFTEFMEEKARAQLN